MSGDGSRFSILDLLCLSNLPHHARGASVSPYIDFRSRTLGGVPRPSLVTLLQPIHNVVLVLQLNPAKTVLASALNMRVRCDPAPIKKSCRPRRDTVGAVVFAPNCRSVKHKTTKRAFRLESVFFV